MPKQFLKGVDRSGLAAGTFFDLRFDEAGAPRPDFVLNDPAWKAASFLVVGPNFGCGSSREHAVWGLLQLGIRVLIGTSFAGIFFDNCARNGLLAIRLDPADFAKVEQAAQNREAQHDHNRPRRPDDHPRCRRLRARLRDRSPCVRR